jgi:hypothetical protein
MATAKKKWVGKVKTVSTYPPKACSQKAQRHRSATGVKKGLSKRPRIGHENAHLLH